MSTLLIGCPIQNRAWILPKYLAHSALAAAGAGYVAEYLFVGDPQSDPDTFRVIDECGWPATSVVVVDESRPKDVRVWNADRYHHMVELRNTMLREVRRIEPELFLSLDSDILLHGQSLTESIPILDGLDHKGRGPFAAVGLLTYMTRNGTSAPSYGLFSRERQIRRPDSRGCFPVDVIMAAKIMTPAAYAVDYVYDQLGEDIGWSKEIAAHGLQLCFDGRLGNKHVMRPEDLDRVDVRCGF